jgi:hypothetical protein
MSTLQKFVADNLQGTSGKIMITKILAYIGLIGWISLIAFILVNDSYLKAQCQAKGGNQLRFFTCVRIVEPARPAKEEVIPLDSIFK